MSVSAVIPAYNAEAFIQRAVDSALNQTVAIDEIIVVDDGSKDRTCALVEAYGGKVRLLRQKNQGPSAARNLAVGTTSAEYLAFLDADDYWAPEKTERQLAALKAVEGAVLCYTGRLNFRDDGGADFVTPAAPPESLPAALRTHNPGVVPSCVLISRELFLQAGGFDVGLKGSEDWDLLIAMLKLGPVVALNEPLTFYQVSTAGLSSNADWMFLEAKKMLARRLLTDYSGPSRWFWRRRVLSYHAYSVGISARAAGQRGKEVRYILYSIWLWPSPFWQAVRFKALAVSVMNLLR